MQERVSIALSDVRRPRDTTIRKLEAALKCRSCKKDLYAPSVHIDQVDRRTGKHALIFGCILMKNADAGTRNTV
jgi:hypothetical protein